MLSALIRIVSIAMVMLHRIEASCYIGSNTLVRFEEGVLTIPKSWPTIPRYAFNTCKQTILAVVLPENISAIMQYAFEGTALTKVTLPDNIISLGKGAFKNTISLESVVFNKALTTIGSDCFANSGLRELALPSSVSTVGSGAFSGAKSLSLVIVNGATQFGDNAFENCKLLRRRDRFSISKNITSVGGLSPFTFIEFVCKNEVCDCNFGYGNSKAGEYFKCVKCSEGKYGNPEFVSGKNWKSCKSCGANRYANSSGMGECSICPYGKYRIRTSPEQECKICPAGRYVKKTTGCYDCNIGYYCPEEGQAKIPCPKGEYSQVTGSKMCEECPAGEYADEEGSIHCKLCPIGRYGTQTKATSEGSCLACPPGKYGDISGTPRCFNCAENFYTNANGSTTCLKCPTGKVSNAGSAGCTDKNEECKPGEQRTEKGTCETCPPGYINPTGVYICSECAAGTYSDVDSIISSKARVGCFPCPAGTFGNKSAAATEEQACHRCPAGKYQSFTGEKECTICPPGASCGALGLTAPQPCQPGSYSDERFQRSCFPCPPGRYQMDDGSAKCEPCGAGKYNGKYGMTNEAEACHFCANGTFAISEGSSNCQPCPVDSYADRPGSRNCTQCPNGKTTKVKRPDGTLSDGLGAEACVVSTRPCSPGAHRVSVTGECTPCGRGYYSEAGIQCKPCPAGKYADQEAMQNCVSCPAGRYGKPGVTAGANLSACALCGRGFYQAFPGMLECVECDPGSECGAVGLSHGEPCVKGRYSDERQQLSCTACPAGRFQTKDGSAKCDLCETGHYGPQLGSFDRSGCLSCPPGKHASHPGSANCSSCTAGQFQDMSGQATCKVCSEVYDSTQTNNAAFTACEFNSALRSESLVDAVFASDAAVYVTLIIAVCFTGIAAIMQWKREKLASVTETSDTTRLIDITRLACVVKSFMPGFSFGSELFLIPAIWQVSHALAITMMVARSLHFLCSTLLLGSAFGNKRFARALDVVVNTLFCQSTQSKKELKDAVNHSFVREEVALVGVMSLLSLGDTTMISFLPWQNSRFGRESKGWPAMDVMKLCLGVKIAQSFLSTACQLTFLVGHADIDNPTTSASAKALFFLNILFSLGGGLMSLLLWFIKKGSLRRLEVERVSTIKASRASVMGLDRSIESGVEETKISEKNEKQHRRRQNSANNFSLCDVYPDADTATTTVAGSAADNPLHALPPGASPAGDVSGDVSGVTIPAPDTGWGSAAIGGIPRAPRSSLAGDTQYDLDFDYGEREAQASLEEDPSPPPVHAQIDELRSQNKILLEQLNQYKRRYGDAIPPSHGPAHTHYSSRAQRSSLASTMITDDLAGGLGGEGEDETDSQRHDELQLRPNDILVSEPGGDEDEEEEFAL